MKKLILLLFSLMLIGFINQASAFTATLNTPAALEDSVRGTYVLNATISDADVSVLNCTFYALSSSTANSTYVVLNATVTNTSTNQTEFTTNWESTAVEDASDYSFKVMCYNATNTSTGTNGGIEIDNGVPTAPSTPTPTDKSTDTDGSVAFSVAVTGSETTGCTLYFSGQNPGSASYAMTHSGDTCTLSSFSIPEQTYYWYVTATDGTNTTNSGTYRVGVDVSHSAPKAAYIQYMQDQGEIESTGGPEFVIGSPRSTFSVVGATEILGYNMKTVLGVPIFLLILIGIIGGFVFINKKK